jgi:hypothetical protein
MTGFWNSTSKVDNLPHDLLMKAVRWHVKCEWVLRDNLDGKAATIRNAF